MKKVASLCGVVLVLILGACGEMGGREPEGERANYEHGGGQIVYKVPLAPGYAWEVTQSWAEHCELCDEKYPGGDSYCVSSHMNGCCKYGWDFNLEGSSDLGKPVLASADGFVYSAGYHSSWGNTVVIDHGQICTRYAHLSLISVSKGQSVCQGEVLGEIGDTGSSDGAHLHFQFEDCGSHKSVKMGFTDGNNIPVCTQDEDVFSGDDYDFLEMTNEIVEECFLGPDDFGDGELPYGGWQVSECGELSGCPMIPNCNRPSAHVFEDEYDFDYGVGAASAYLYSECALDGYSDGTLRPRDEVNRAEVLKVALSLFGLAGQCGDSPGFFDVSEDDWYFPYVACAVKHGIVDDSNAYFGAGETATFAETAKILVLSAEEAGVIDLSDYSGDVFWQISPNHWAYEYLITLYAYGGLPSPMPKYDADHRMLRRDLIVMASSLSPCFCPNVICRNGCSCHQATFSCINPYDQGSGTGGWDDDPGSDPGGWGDDPVSGPSGKIFDLEIDCYVKTENTRCENGGTVLYIKCSLFNNGAEEVKINDLIMNAEEMPSGCQITDAHLKSGEGVTSFDPGEEKGLSGHFEILCLGMPTDDSLEIVFDLVEKISGVKTLYQDLIEAVVDIPPDPFEQCDGVGMDPGGADPADDPVDPPCVPLTCETGGIECGIGSDGCGKNFSCPACEYGYACVSGFCESDPCLLCPWGIPCLDGVCQTDEWACDPSVGYRIVLESPGGSYEAIATGFDGTLTGAIDPGKAVGITFECSELPGAILFHGTEWSLAEADEGLPSFAVWAPWGFDLMLTPFYNPDVVGTSFGVSVPDMTILIRVPAEM